MKLTQTYIGMFTTNNPTTGEPSNTDSVPIVTVFKNGEITNDISMIVSETSSNPSNDQGVYKIVATETWSAAGFSVDDKVDIYIYAIINGTNSHAIIDSFILDNGVILASDGLDNILLAAEPTGRATTFREMVVQLWMRFFNKVDRTSAQIRVYNEAGDTAITTQAHEDVGDVVTVDKAS